MNVDAFIGSETVSMEATMDCSKCGRNMTHTPTNITMLGLTILAPIADERYRAAFQALYPDIDPDIRVDICFTCMLLTYGVKGAKVEEKSDAR